MRFLVTLATFVTLASAQATQPVRVAPECGSQNFQFTASGNGTAINNLTNGLQCDVWSITYSSTGFSGVTLTVQDAPDASGLPGPWVTFAGTVTTGINPNTSLTGAFTKLTGFFPWMRVVFTGTGTGRVTGVLRGYQTSARSGGGATIAHTTNALKGDGLGNAVGVIGASNDCVFADGSTGVCAAVGSIGTVQLSDGAGTLSGFADLIWHESPTATGMTGLQVGIAEPNLSCCDGSSNVSSFIRQGTNGVQQNYLTAGSGGILQSYYISGGTVSSPTNLIGAHFISFADSYAFLGGGYQLVTSRESSWEGANAGLLTDTVYDGASGQPLAQSTLGSNGVSAAEWAIGAALLGSQIGFSPLVASVAELNNGTVGTVTRLNLLSVNSLSVTFASLTALADGTIQSCSDCTVTSPINDQCISDGSGAVSPVVHAMAERINGVWRCRI